MNTEDINMLTEMYVYEYYTTETTVLILKTSHINMLTEICFEYYSTETTVLMLKISTC